MKSERKLWKDTLNYRLASAYQDVIDECDNLFDTEDIKTSFDNYVSLVEEQAKASNDELLEFVKNNLQSNGMGCSFIDTDCLISFICKRKNEKTV
jgi:arabinogalactan endo-1,4-beta-galactosidase